MSYASYVSGNLRENTALNHALENNCIAVRVLGPKSARIEQNPRLGRLGIPFLKEAHKWLTSQGFEVDRNSKGDLRVQGTPVNGTSSKENQIKFGKWETRFKHGYMTVYGSDIVGMEHACVCMSQGTQTGDGDTTSFRWEVYDDSFKVLARGTVAGDKGLAAAQRASEAAARGLFH